MEGNEEMLRAKVLSLEALVEKLEQENAALKAKYKALENDMVLQATILCAVEDVLNHNEVSDFMESFPIVRSVMDLIAQAQLKQPTDHDADKYYKEAV